jgi:hypothetical protein
VTHPLPSRRRKFDLLESGGPSARLRLVTAYYGLSAGLFGVVIMASAIYAAAASGSVRDRFLAHPWRTATSAVVCLSMVQTWRLLRDKRRSGAIAAAIPVLIGMVSQFRSDAPIGWLSLGESAVGLILLATVWNELEQHTCCVAASRH